MISKERKKLYEDLESRIGKTPLVRYNGVVPNGNTIWIKRECDNPFGSHYDRVYLALYRDFEENKGLQPGMNVLETTSGSAGVSFAGIGGILGYTCYVMIPQGDQLQRRREAIIEQRGRLILTPEDEYINGFTKKRITENIKKYGAKFFNHSMGPKDEQTGRYTNNEVTLRSLEGIAREVLSEISVDFYVAGIGNGSSIIGPGRIFREYNPNVQIIGYKPKKSGKSDFPGLINQDELNPLVVIPFPHVAEANKLMDEVVLIDEEWARGIFDHDDLGKSGKAGIRVALEIAKKVKGKNLVVLGYDIIDRYGLLA